MLRTFAAKQHGFGNLGDVTIHYVADGKDRQTPWLLRNLMVGDSEIF
jgi:hypothetical protein